MRKWRNEEMETLVRAKPWVMYWQKIDRQSRQPGFYGFGSLACKTIQLINGWHL